MSPHLVADGLVQVKGRERWTLSLPVPRGDHWPVHASSLVVTPCVLLEVLNHADWTVPRQDVCSSLAPAGPLPQKIFAQLAGSGSSWARLRLLRICLEDPIPLAILLDIIWSDQSKGLIMTCLHQCSRHGCSSLAVRPGGWFAYTRG